MEIVNGNCDEGEEGSSDPLLGNYGIFTGFGTCRPRRRFGRATVIAIVIWHPNERSVRVSPLNFFRSAPMGEGGGSSHPTLGKWTTT